jgi:glycosyltransferase involved in cell wall biosynthesis
VSEAAVTGTGLPYRNALADLAPSAWDVVARGADDRAPLVTIAIPTFRRPETLVEAVASALSQSFGEPFEIVVADNNPASRDAERLLDALPQLANANFRYLVNRENVGMYGNHNVCLLAARGEWVTILHDDDLLDPDFLSTMFAELKARPDTDGLVCRKRFRDERGPGPRAGEVLATKPRTPLFSERMSGSLVRRYLVSGRRARWELTERMVDKALAAAERRYLAGVNNYTSRKIGARQLFWAPLTGNIVAFVFRRSAALAIGGFYSEEAPSADDRFYIRFASAFHLRLHRAELATLRIAENETLKHATVKLALEQKAELHRLVAGRAVPRWYLLFSPMIIRRLWTEYKDFWRTEVPYRELEASLGRPLPPDRFRTLLAVRLLLRAW